MPLGRGKVLAPDTNVFTFSPKKLIETNFSLSLNDCYLVDTELALGFEVPWEMSVQDQPIYSQRDIKTEL